MSKTASESPNVRQTLRNHQTARFTVQRPEKGSKTAPPQRPLCNHQMFRSTLMITLYAPLWSQKQFRAPRAPLPCDKYAPFGDI